MIVNIIGIGSLFYFISSYLNCTPTKRTKTPSICLKIGGCPYNQDKINPMTLRLRICNISVTKCINNIS